MSAFPGVSSYQSSSLGSKFVVIGVVCCQEMRRNALFHKVLPVLTKYLIEFVRDFTLCQQIVLSHTAYEWIGVKPIANIKKIETLLWIVHNLDQ